MIDRRELRIGNWVGTVYNVPYIKITEIKNHVVCGVNCKGVSYPSLKPIPLTEEILLKCGFVKDETDQDKNIISGNICDYILESDNGGNYFLGVNHGENTLYFSWDIKYLHQLQNLYYALMGEELEVKL